MFIRIACIGAAYLVYAATIGLLDGRAPAAASETAFTISHGDYLGGRDVWLASSCQACHSIYGLGGHLGPDLTNIARPGMGGYVRSVVANGRGAMPSFELSERELELLTSYLGAINATGVYPPRTIRGPVFGGVR